MRLNKKFLCICLTLLLVLGLSQHAIANQAMSAGMNNSLASAVTGGEFRLNLRYRYEHVDDDLVPRNANASTLRTALTYRTATWQGLSALLEIEQVSRIFSGNFNEGLGQPSPYATVVDPDGTELNQGYLRYQSDDLIDLKLGRQVITYRGAPLHRHIGNILWRQNWQTFDAVTAVNDSLPDTTVSYAYVWRVNRIFGESAPEPLSNFDSNSHFINIRNNRFDWANLETYAYLLDFDNAARFSAGTIGVRLHGQFDLNPQWQPLYAAEYAYQSDYADNPNNYSANYQLLQAGIRYEPASMIDNIEVRLAYERLSGDGRPNGSFVTILGTNHAFQGTADRFLITPNDGIQDYQALLKLDAYGFNFQAGYHALYSDHLDYRYGNELNLELSRKLAGRYTVGAKYADYNASGNFTNRLRNGAQASDVEKIWFYIMAQF